MSKFNSEDFLYNISNAKTGIDFIDSMIKCDNNGCDFYTHYDTDRAYYHKFFECTKHKCSKGCDFMGTHSIVSKHRDDCDIYIKIRIKQIVNREDSKMITKSDPIRHAKYIEKLHEKYGNKK